MFSPNLNPVYWLELLVFITCRLGAAIFRDCGLTKVAVWRAL
jgi:hypothetical protein